MLLNFMQKSDSQQKIKCKMQNAKYATPMQNPKPMPATLNAMYAASLIVQLVHRVLESLGRVRKSAADGETSLPVQRLLGELVEVLSWVGNVGDISSSVFQHIADNVLEVGSKL